MKKHKNRTLPVTVTGHDVNADNPPLFLITDERLFLLTLFLLRVPAHIQIQIGTVSARGLHRFLLFGSITTRLLKEARFSAPSTMFFHFSSRNRRNSFKSTFNVNVARQNEVIRHLKAVHSQGAVFCQ